MTEPTGAKDNVRLPVNVIAVLDRCALIERKCAEVYQGFARMHAEFPELQALWFKTALEEETHAAQFAMLCKLKRSDILGLSVEIGDAQAVLESMDGLLAKVKTGYLAPEKALELAVKLESQIAKFHSNAVVLCKEPELKKLLDAMMGNDQEHQATLEKALRDLQKGSGSGLTEVLKKVERLVEEIDAAGLAPAETLKAALKFESLLSRLLVEGAARQKDPELRQILKNIMDKNSSQLQLIHQSLERYESLKDGKLAEDLRLARLERRD